MDKDRWDRGRHWNDRVNIGTNGSKFERGLDQTGTRSKSPERREERPRTPDLPREEVKRRSVTPPVRADSPLRGDRDDGSDMDMDD